MARRPQAESFATAGTVRTFPNVRIETVELDDASVGHCFFEPGWLWSRDLAPVVGTATCQVRHVGYSVSGTTFAGSRSIPPRGSWRSATPVT